MKKLYIDPSYHVFDRNGLFDLSNPILNRDDQLLSFYRLREYMSSKGVSVSTSDYLLEDTPMNPVECEYYSLGILDNYKRVSLEKRARLAAFIIMEPPVVLPSLYKELPKLTKFFDRVYLPNICGDGYSLDGVDVRRLSKLYWPIPYGGVLGQYWNNTNRMRRIVVINGNHKPVNRFREQYSLRIDAMAELSKYGVIDLYGGGWNKWWSRSSRWLPYWANRSAIMSIYKGGCKLKFEVLQRYDFSLCFENMAMEGYVTEKIFDCLYSGTIPLYMGAPNILEYIPKETFIDCRKYSSWTEMWSEIESMPTDQIIQMRKAGKDFLESDLAQKFYNSMQDICEN